MRISDVVKSASARFSILLLEPEQVQQYLFQALTAYQDLAGCITTLRILEPKTEAVALPPSFLAAAVCRDTFGNYVATRISESDDGTATLIIEGQPAYPVEFDYFVHIAYYADKPDLHIPNRIAGMVIDYLECLIAMENDDRMARVEAGGKMDVSRLPTRIDRIAQKTALEDQFRANRAMPQMTSIHPE